MALIDEVRIHAQAGHGGPGVTRWLHIRGQDKGGPAGGDGGRGGDIIFEGVRDMGALATFRFTKKFRAENGKPGGNDNKHGRDAEPIILKVPVGTVAKITTTGQTFEILTDGQREVVFKGGPGGFGNAHFKSSTNQNPVVVTKGKPGGVGDIEITLKLIADAGFIGFPNAGKSSLLNALTRASSKVAAYPFTTLDPHLGSFYGYVLADIPGLIEGASSGRGLGSKFLRHVERTGLLVHLVSAEQEDPVASYRAIRNELQAFGRGLAEKKELIVLSKSDVLSKGEEEKLLSLLKEASGGGDVTAVSIIDDDALKAFSDRLASLLKSKTSVV